MTYIQAELHESAIALATETLFDDTPDKAISVQIGLCSTCDNCVRCVWKQNNKIECEHFE
jgi:hypothetical protein